ncbi:MAG TPA: Calx-beta domain-containing protein [Chloroflexota bacterium]|nr:Calx-beta domain-containing protein [Chloroflexota bacterium]
MSVKRVLQIVRIILFSLALAVPGASAKPVLAASATPSNDNFSDAQLIVGSSGGVKGSNVGATKEIGEPDHAAGASIWYQWVAPTSGVFAFDTHGSSFDTILGVYTGNLVDKLTEIGFNDNGKDFTSEVDFVATPGTTYSILVDGAGGQTGDVLLNWQAAAPPPNDAFTTAQVISGTTGTVSGTNVGATREPNEPFHAGDPGSASVWYTWTAPADGSYHFEVNADFGALLASYTGDSLATLTPLAGDGPGVLSRVSVNATKGTIYHLAIDGSTKSPSGATGQFTLAWRSSPPNDNFADAQPITGPSGQVTGDNTGATREPGEPFHAGVAGQSSVWYDWKAPVTGPTVFYIGTAPFDTQLAVYTGTSVDSLVPIASNDNSGLYTLSELTFPAVEGTEYRIAVDGYGKAGNTSGPFVVGWSPPPPNDAFANAVPIGGESGQVTGTNHGATREALEPAAAGASVWYRFTAPSDGIFLFDPTGSTFDVVVGLYSGSSLDAVQALPTIYSRGAALRVTAGSVYDIAIDGRRSCAGGGSCSPDVDRGSYVLTWSHVPPPTNDSFAAATKITGASGRLVDSNLGATKEPGEPNHAGSPGGASLWYLWTAPANSRFTFDVGESDVADLIAVYQGTAVNSLTTVPVSRATQSRPKVRFVAVAGQSYAIAVDQSQARAGQVVLVWNPAPPNDDFVDAQTLTGSTGTTDGTTVGATREDQEPAHAGSATDTSVWYRWTAPAAAAFSFTVQPEKGSEAVIAVYTGSSPGNLVTVGSNNKGALQFSATPAVEYRIAVAVPCVGVAFNCSPAGTFSLQWTQADAPANDMFSAAQSISGGTGSIVANLDGATKEVGEPDHGGRAGAASVWYAWTAPADGVVTFTTLDPANVAEWTLLAVYTGPAVDQLTAVPRARDPGFVNLNPANDSADVRNNKVTFLARAGTRYLVAIDRKAAVANSLARGNVTLRWDPPPANDDLANAAPMSGAAGQLKGTLHGATEESGEPYQNIGDSSVWYTWVAPQDGAFRARADGYPVMVATGNTITGLNTVPFYLNPNDPNTYVFDVSKGSTYRIAVDGFYTFGISLCIGDCIFAGVPQQDFNLSWDMGPVNDLFARAATITGPSGTVRVSNVGATKEPGEPDHAGQPGGASLWYTWTAPADGVVTFDTRGSQVDTLLALYTGVAISNLQPVGAGKFSGGGTRVQLSAKAGQTYFIALDGFQGATGNLTLNWEPPPVNDNFVSAAAIAGPTGRVTGTTIGATREPTEPLHAGFPGIGSVWYTWTATDDAVFRFDVTGSDFAPILAVYTGSSLDKLTPVASTLDMGVVTFTARRGTVYQIAVDGPDNSTCSPCKPNTGQVVLAWDALQVSVGDVTVTEGDGGTTPAKFPVNLSFATDQPVTVSYATADGTATSPADYATTTGTITFAPGQTRQDVTVPIVGDLLIEPTETFRLVLSAPQNATLAAATATGTILDEDGPPRITAFTAPSDPIAVKTAFTATLSFSDLDLPDTHTAVVDWGDGSRTTATISEANGKGTGQASHAYTAAGLYTLTATVTDLGGGVGTATYRYAIAIDPSAGAVSGDGWIRSGSSRGNFDFGVHYGKSSGVPTGSFEFDVPDSRLSLASTGFQWLVVNGNRAVFQGTGTINGKGDYLFLVSLTDGSGDCLRVKVWDRVSGSVVFDSQPNDPIDAPATTVLGAGSVQIR